MLLTSQNRLRMPMTFKQSPTMAKAEFGRETSPSYIVRSANGSPIPPVCNSPMYGDFVGIPDFLGSLRQVIKGRQAFETFPVHIRDRFGNDPAKLLAFIHSDRPEDRVEAIKLGLIPPPKKPDPPQRVEIVNPVLPPSNEGKNA